MVFNSISFLIFFPIVLCVYFVMPKQIRRVWLLVSSYYFYMCWNPVYSLLILASTLITYFCGLIIGKSTDNLQIKKLVLFIGLLSNLGILFYFKYFNFLMESWNHLGVIFHIKIMPTHSLLLPVGISFFTFQALGYMIDVYRGTTKAEKNIVNYALFVSFFPQLVAGPIERSDHFLKQIQLETEHKLWNYERVTSGLMIMLWGFFQKVVIADRIAVIVDTVFHHYEQYEMFGLSIGAIAFGIQIYCDFSGYSWIAIGAAKVLDFELMENFNTPYLSRSIVDFWRRWHISLTAWFRDYVYIPLGGNRCSKMKHYRNIMITFLLSGLWHGANWTYVVWGGIHGIYQIVEKEITPWIGKLNSKCNTKVESFGYKLSQILLTFFFVDFAWIFFRANTIRDALHYIYRMFRFRDYWSFYDESILTLGLDLKECWILLLALVALAIVDLIKYQMKQNIDSFLSTQWIVFRWAVLVGLIYNCVIYGYYGPGFDSAQFLYFQF